ncbi:MAG TPA: hypothetical protein VM802_14790, partial [Chitinophaga sp.]|uniref:hypothetical protein n=1 Tax=Chitinophaga sp. TaxID=1869181 RepID=UPI002CF7F9E8
MSLDIHMPFKLFASCLPVRGASRSAICDTQRQELHLIPNELYDLLQQYDGGKISTILDQYDEENAATVVEYFEFLYDKELIFFTPVPESFPPISLVYESPVRITNAIIDTDPSHARLPWRRMAAQLSALGCGHLEIRCFSACSVAYFIDVLRYFDDTRIRSIDLIMRYTYDSDATISFLLAEFPRVTGICFHGSPDEGSSHEGKVVYLRQLITGSDHCGIISPGYFAINIKMFA